MSKPKQDQDQASNPTTGSDAPNPQSLPGTANPPSGAESEAQSLPSSTDQQNQKASQPDAASASEGGRPSYTAMRKAERETADECRQKLLSEPMPPFVTPGLLLTLFAAAFDRLPAREQHAEMKFIREHFRSQAGAIEAFELRHREAREANEDVEDAAADAAASETGGE